MGKIYKEFKTLNLVYLLRLLSEEHLLVGGQSLSFWVQHFNIIDDNLLSNPLTTDIDIVGDLSLIKRIQKKLGGVIELPGKKQFNSVLVGVVDFPLGNNEYNHLDVLHKVPGLNLDLAKKRAYKKKLSYEGIECEISMLHPLDTLKNKLYNIAYIKEKSDDNALLQASLAIQVANAYLSHLVDTNNIPSLFKAIEEISALNNTPFGRIIKSKSLIISECFPFDKLRSLQHDSFIKERLPRLIQSFSDQAKLNDLTD